MMVAGGQMDAWIEPKVAPWDLAAAQVILEEAGAVFFAFDGERSIYKGSAVACTPGIEGEMRAFFKASLNGAV
jgi:fructose-1,6-bisphosphatase/inositol monophosphatase family enzyme